MVEQHIIAVTAGQCSGILDGDLVAPAVALDTTPQYRISNQLLVAAEQNLTPKLVLEGRVFVSTLVQNFLDEFKKGGCVNDFGNTVGEPLHKVVDFAKEAPETVENLGHSMEGAGLTLGGAAGTALLSKGIDVSGAAGAVGKASFPAMLIGADLALGGALVKESVDMAKGNCQ